MALNSRAFETSDELLDHFNDHVLTKGEFPKLKTEGAYLYRADEFLTGVLDTKTTLQCQRTKKDGSKGDIVRYNKVTQEFGILTNYNVIRTYFIVNPLEHHLPTNYDYFVWNCNRKKG